MPYEDSAYEEIPVARFRLRQSTPYWALVALIGTILVVVGVFANWVFAVVGAPMACGGLLMLVVTNFILLIDKLVRRRLVIGEDCLTIVDSDGQVRVVVPFYNVNSVILSEGPAGKFVGIRLRDISDPETVFSGGEAIRRQWERMTGFHIPVHTASTGELKRVRSRITFALEAFQGGTFER